MKIKVVILIGIIAIVVASLVIYNIYFKKPKFNKLDVSAYVYSIAGKITSIDGVDSYEFPQCVTNFSIHPTKEVFFYEQDANYVINKSDLIININIEGEVAKAKFYNDQLFILSLSIYKHHIYIFDINDLSKPKFMTEISSDKIFYGSVTYNGKYIAYVSDEFEVIMLCLETNELQLISTNGKHILGFGDNFLYLRTNSDLVIYNTETNQENVLIKNYEIKPYILFEFFRDTDSTGRYVLYQAAKYRVSGEYFATFILDLETEKTSILPEILHKGLFKAQRWLSTEQFNRIKNNFKKVNK